jgi:arylsulfatase
LDGTDFMTMVRSNEWKLVHFIDEDDGQLFDLVNDPDEVKNLWSDPDYADTKSEMLTELREWHIRSRVQTASWAAGAR